MGDGSRVTFGNIGGSIHDSKFAGRDIVEVVIQIVQQTGGALPSMRSLSAQLAALQQALPQVDSAARAATQTALDHLAQAIATLPRHEQIYLDHLKGKYAEESAYYIPLTGKTTETSSPPSAASSPHDACAARRRSHRAEAEYHEWITTEREIKRVKLNTLREGVDKYLCLILLGDPGCGKTTALENVAYEFPIVGANGHSPLLPLPLRLSEFGPGLTLFAK